MTQHSPSELERFSNRVSSVRTVAYSDAFEQQVHWELGDRAGSSRTMKLLSGLTLSVSEVRWDQAWTLCFDPDPSKLKFIVNRGPGPRVTAGDETPRHLAGGTAHLSRIQRPVDLRFDFGEPEDGRAHEELCLEVDRERLLELTGSQQLPMLVDRVWFGAESFPVEALAAPAASYRLLDEIAECRAQGAGQRLYLEAKGLELLAAWVDQLQNEQDATRLCTHDVERLEQARRVLLSRMTTPPRLAELARLVGLNEAKLKAGFRLHFGDTVFGHLRRHRLETAHRLLSEGRYNVTEVALRVGYANPSKFAAAFRSMFGISPSHLR